MRILNNQQGWFARRSLLQYKNSDQAQKFVGRTQFDVITKMVHDRYQQIGGVQPRAVDDSHCRIMVQGIDKSTDKGRLTGQRWALQE